MRALDGIVEYEPADLTLTAGGGTPLAALTRETARAGQWLALDAPGLGDATLGGAVARGLAGALAASHGALRDLVLGLTLVTGDGRVLRLGGRVVKNVAGFDLVRLVVGSRGALGVITSVTVRLHPRPRADRTWIRRGDRPESLVTAAARLASMDVPPASVELGWGRDGAILAVRALGSVSGVTDFGNRLDPLLPGAEVLESVEGERVRRDLRMPLDDSAARVRLARGAGGLDALLARARLRADEAGAPFRGWMLADHGVAWVGLPEGAAPDGAGGELSGEAREWARGLKRAFDPAGILPFGPFPSGPSPAAGS
jgi:FAD/FMN-containing dehydrogenase